MRYFFSSVIAIFLSACASAPAPTFSGPTAFISDSVVQEDSKKGQIFYVDQIDGRTVDSAYQETTRASRGKGFTLSLWSKLRQVEVKPIRLKLVASHITGAPIHEIASRALGTFFSVEGEVLFTPVPGGKYVVTGVLAKEGSSVWLADEETLVPVTTKITSAR
jgi:hypothetical protein